MDNRWAGCLLIIAGLVLLVGALLFGANALADCQSKGGVMLHGHCVKAEIIK